MPHKFCLYLIYIKQSRLVRFRWTRNYKNLKKLNCQLIWYSDEFSIWAFHIQIPTVLDKLNDLLVALVDKSLEVFLVLVSRPVFLNVDIFEKRNLATCAQVS